MPRAISCSAKLSPRHAKISRSPLRTALPGTRPATPPALTTASPSPAQAHLQPFRVLGMVAPAVPPSPRPYTGPPDLTYPSTTARSSSPPAAASACRYRPQRGRYPNLFLGVHVLRRVRRGGAVQCLPELRRVCAASDPAGRRAATGSLHWKTTGGGKTGPPEMVPRRDRRIREAGARYSLREPLSHRPPCCAT